MKAGAQPIETTEMARPERDHALELWRDMLRIRRFEEKAAELYGYGKIRGFLHLYIGEEAVAAGSLRALTMDDAIVATYREHGQALVRGTPAAALMAELLRQRPTAAAAAAVARCTSSTSPDASTAATRSSAADCRSPSAWRSPTSCRAASA